MKRIIEKDKTLLIDGPASVEVLSGKTNVLGATVRKGEKLVVREGKRVPFETNKRTVFDLMLGNEASSEEIEGSTIPSSWKEALTEIFSLQRPVTVVVMGCVDSGKTSFCTFLANEAVRRKWKTAIIDADLGQSDIGPPSTIGFSRVNSHVKDLFEIDAESAFFVGATSPTGAVKRVLDGLTILRNKALEVGTDFLIINTDGWVEGENAVEYKVGLKDCVGPHVVVGIQHEDEMEPILSVLNKTKTIAVACPPMAHKRNREKRKVLRELSYTKYLKGAKIHSFPLSWIRIEGGVFGGRSAPPPERIKMITNSLGRYPVHCEESPALVFIVLRKGQWIDEEQIAEAEERLGKRLKVVREGEEEGLLLALHDERGEFLGIGVLCGVDYKRKAIKVYTPIGKDVAVVRFGQIKLDKKGRETGLSTVYANYHL